ncbi:hypothetical protein GOV03_03145 [Candidatus Woesearchaeota archaeon]|nr:hypothetical protein [Candidatus Woesearchaeota archaeon]
MNIFDCKPEELATHFTTDPELYNQGIKFLKGLREERVFSSQFEGSLEETLAFFEKANAIARESDYFVFDTYDSWAYEIIGMDNGYSVYQKIGNELVRILGVGDRGAPHFEEIIEVLQEKKVKKVFTLSIPESYFGLERECVNEGVDNHVIRYDVLEEGTIDEFKEEGIEVVVLRP